MTERTVTRLCGMSLVFSGVVGLAAAPVGASIGYPIVIDFGDGSTL